METLPPIVQQVHFSPCWSRGGINHRRSASACAAQTCVSLCVSIGDAEPERVCILTNLRLRQCRHVQLAGPGRWRRVAGVRPIQTPGAVGGEQGGAQRNNGAPLTPTLTHAYTRCINATLQHPICSSFPHCAASPPTIGGHAGNWSSRGSQAEQSHSSSIPLCRPARYMSVFN